MAKTFRDVEVGEVVTRMLGGTTPVKLRVTEITQQRIVCGPWSFGRHDGQEIDDDISVTTPVSYLDESKL